MLDSILAPKAATTLLIACLFGSVHAQDIPVCQSRDLSSEQHKARDLSVEQPREQQPRRSQPQPGAQPASPVSAAASALVGAWSTSVPGAVWSSPGQFPGRDRLDVSAGANSGLLVIHPDGIYVRNAYGGKQGRWQPSGRTDYSIVLDDPAERRKWLAGLDTRDPSRVYLWDGNTFSCQGKRIC